MLNLYRCYHKGFPPLSWIVRLATRPAGWSFAQVPGHVATVIVNGECIEKIESTWPKVRRSYLTTDQWNRLQFRWRQEGLVCAPVKRDLAEPEKAGAYLIGRIGEPYGTVALVLDFAGYVLTALFGRWLKKEGCRFSLRDSYQGPKDCAELANIAEGRGGGHPVYSATPVSPAQLLRADVRHGLVSFDTH